MRLEKVWRGFWGREEAEGKEITPDADLLAQVRFESREAGDSGSYKQFPNLTGG